MVYDLGIHNNFSGVLQNLGRLFSNFKWLSSEFVCSPWESHQSLLQFKQHGYVEGHIQNICHNIQISGFRFRSTVAFLWCLHWAYGPTFCELTIVSFAMAFKMHGKRYSIAITGTIGLLINTDYYRFNTDILIAF